MAVYFLLKNNLIVFPLNSFLCRFSSQAYISQEYSDYFFLRIIVFALTKRWIPYILITLILFFISVDFPLSFAISSIDCGLCISVVFMRITFAAVRTVFEIRSNSICRYVTYVTAIFQRVIIAFINRGSTCRYVIPHSICVYY